MYYYALENIQKNIEKSTITYISGGKIGDFIQQLSVIYEKYLVDRKLAILYISNHGGEFLYGVDKAYQDLYPIVSRQPYIKEFKIHNGEPYDIDLSSWRNHAFLMFEDNYLSWMKKEYGIEWGRHKWILDIPKDPRWETKVIINTTPNRFPTLIDWGDVFQNSINDIVFVGFEPENHQHFSRVLHHIPYYCPKSMIELAIILNSCKMFVGSLSSPLSIAFGLHIPVMVGLYNNPFDFPAFCNMAKNIFEK